ncbi:MAG: glutamine amidotransferase-related protein [Myxococcaceae bacterium]
MNAVVIQHEEHEGLGLFGPALEQAGFKLRHRFRTAKHEDVSADLLVVLGGGMAVYEMDQHPFLAEEQAVLAERLAQGKPCLGICLGAQLMAAATGAEVFPGKNGFEVGVAPVRWTARGLADPVLKGVTAKTQVVHWHGDTYQPVEGATLLASTDRYTQQGFKLGDSYAFQFHLELSADDYERWLATNEEDLLTRGKDPVALKAASSTLRAAAAQHQGVVERLVHHFSRCAQK